MSVPMRQMLNQAKKISAYFYTYSVLFTATVTATTATQQVNIQADSNFLVQQLIFGTLSAANPQVPLPIPAITIQITDASSGMTLFDRAMPIWMVAGTPQLPYLLPTPRTFPASSSIQVSLTNNDGANRDTYLMFAGQKVSRLGS